MEADDLAILWFALKMTKLTHTQMENLNNSYIRGVSCPSVQFRCGPYGMAFMYSCPGSILKNTYGFSGDIE